MYTVTGTILDVSPHVLVLRTELGEQRFPLASCAQAWRGGQVPPAALRQGDHAIVRRQHPGGPVVDRIWAQVGRATGTIIERKGPATLLVDEGPASGRKVVIIASETAGRIQVRFPRLEPGYLIDVIGLKQDGFLQALIPATSQPPYRAGHPPAPPMVSGHVPDPVSGSAVWHEPGEEPADVLGLAYPALDPETSCERAGSAPPECSGDEHGLDPHATGPGCVRLPYLSLGSMLRLRNDCAERSRMVPVTSCGAAARLFCDRCVTCGTSEQGPDRRPHHGGLRGTRRRPRSRMLQRHDDDRRLADAHCGQGVAGSPAGRAAAGWMRTKAWRMLRSRSVAPAMDPVGLFPLRLRRPMMLATFAAELAWAWA